MSKGGPLDGGVLIVGTGLLGTSLGLALRRAGVDVRLRDHNADALAEATGLGAGEPDEGGPAAALAVVAVPPTATAAVVAEVLDTGLAEYASDVASVKELLAEQVRSLAGEPGRYVGGHPMAGREVSGPGSALVDLFEGRPWVLCPDQGTDPHAVTRALAVARAVGAIPVTMPAADHDAAVALVSHAPHLVAALVAARLAEAPAHEVRLAGTGVTDVTRVAAGDPALWTEILTANAAAVSDVLRALRADLDHALAALGSPLTGREQLAGLLRTGVDGRGRLPGKHGAPPTDYATVTVVIGDRPGQLAALFADAGKAGVNVEDVRIEHSPGQPVGLVELDVKPGADIVLAVALREAGWSLQGAALPSSRPLRAGEGAHVSSSLVVAIDGPSGSGKSTVARRVAASLGLRYLDTGAMYRALTWWLLEQGVDLGDQARVAELARDLPLRMGTDPDHPTVHVEHTDVATAIRETRISAAVSAVATNLGVRQELVRRQRQEVEEGGVVVEGRDITTVVAPDAPVRVLLTADERTRLARRAHDVHGAADEAAVAAIRDQVLRRDADDSTVASFLQAGEGVDVVDSSKLSPEETVQAVLDLVRQRVGVGPE
jgi:prephenate dehydrogenase